MNPIPHHSVAPPPWFPLPPLPPNPLVSSAFWETRNVSDRLKDLHDTLSLAKAMQKELEMLVKLKEARSVEDVDDRCSETSVNGFRKYLEDRRISLGFQESHSVEAANALLLKLKAQLEPFRAIGDESCPWEEKSAAIRLSNKRQKSKRNKHWRKRKRKRMAEMLAQDREQFDRVNQEADEWRAREIAKDTAKLKVEKMKEIAKIKAKEEKKRLESELELVLMVEKLQELRSLRIQKLKKHGHFLPEEDDKFMEKVRAAVEEEERQAIAAADIDAAKDAISTAESRIINLKHGSSKDPNSDKDEENKDPIPKRENDKDSNAVGGEDSKTVNDKDSGNKVAEGQGQSGAYDTVSMEFYHYYYGSSTDMGTLIEVRRTWDAYIRPGGSRIPRHWVQPPPPSDEIWASYLVRSK